MRRGRPRYHRCEEHADVPIIEGWAQVLSLADEVEAKLIEENLRAEGVDARVLSQKDHSAFPVDLGDLAVIRVLAPTYAFQDAKRIIDAHRDAVGRSASAARTAASRTTRRTRLCRVRRSAGLNREGRRGR
jgi:hypothetical protein